MNQKKQLSILEFSRLTGIKRENLRFYDRIGLLSPEMRGENNYRYYSRHQLNTAYLITSLRGLGVGIEDIKRHSAERTPEKALALYEQQNARIQAEIQHLRDTSLIMLMQSDTIREALIHNENDLFLQQKEEEPIFLCPPIPDNLNEDEGGIFSYDYADANGVNLGFPQGTLIKREQLTASSDPKPDSYYFKTNRGCNARKPAGLYAVAYDRCEPWLTVPIYQRLLTYIKDQSLSICGDAYEEYPMGDAATPDTLQCCIRIEIPVTKDSF